MKKSLLAFAVVLAALPFFAAAEKVPVELMSCRELLCTNRADTFLVNESAYIDYNSSVRGISYSATLTFPDGNKYQIMLPNRIASNFTGNYTVELTAWKDGYEETKLTKVVRFVEKPSEPQNPITINPIPVLVVILIVLIAIGSWRYLRIPERRKERKHKKEKKIS